MAGNMSIFDAPSPSPASFCRRLSSREYEIQGSVETEKELVKLLSHLDRDPELCRKFFRKKKIEEMENSGALGYLKTKLMLLFQGEDFFDDRLSEEECKDRLNKLKNSIIKTFEYAEEAKGTGRRFSARLVEKEERRTKGSKTMGRKMLKDTEYSSPAPSAPPSPPPPYSYPEVAPLPQYTQVPPPPPPPPPPPSVTCRWDAPQPSTSARSQQARLPSNTAYMRTPNECNKKLSPQIGQGPTINKSSSESKRTVRFSDEGPRTDFIDSMKKISGRRPMRSQENTESRTSPLVNPTQDDVTLLRRSQRSQQRSESEPLQCTPAPAEISQRRSLRSQENIMLQISPKGTPVQGGMSFHNATPRNATVTSAESPMTKQCPPLNLAEEFEQEISMARKKLRKVNHSQSSLETPYQSSKRRKTESFKKQKGKFSIFNQALIDKFRNARSPGTPSPAGSPANVSGFTPDKTFS